MKLNYVTLTLKTSAGQQQDLDRLLTELQDPFSPNFRKWLTPGSTRTASPRARAIWPRSWRG